MSRKLMLLVSLLLSMAASAAVMAQSIDPCQFGCPKEGCPQCDSGGPIEDGSEGESGDDAGGEGSDDESEDEDSSGDLPA